MRVFGSLQDAHVYFTECQLATLERLAMKKRAPKSEISRHRSIALNMLLYVTKHTLRSEAPRVGELIERKDALGTFEMALDEWLAGLPR